ncbi:MAG: PqqD family peptide modification chaperone, partial [Polyangiaceae bacterium]|nr:PqqD family peptide modification chaperone [Anaerolineae bacterium]MCU0694643.1 PqqD family peptide modification chaperone [Polyangiaceae bacterium]
MSQHATLTLDTIVARRAGIMSAQVGNETATMNVEKGMYYGIDDVGTRIWELVETPCAVSEICEELTEQYDVDIDTCRQDVIRFLGVLLDAEILD